MTWFGGSLTSITGSLSTLTKDLLSEGTKEVDDPATHLKVARGRITELENALANQKSEIDCLKSSNDELRVQLESAELRLHHVKVQVTDKERLIVQLRDQLGGERGEPEGQSAALGLVVAGPAPIQNSVADHSSTNAEDDYEDDSAADEFASEDLQQDGTITEMQLRAQVARLQEEIRLWRRRVRQNVPASYNQPPDDRSASQELRRLRAELEGTRDELSASEEARRQEVAALQDAHSRRLADLTRTHREELVAAAANTCEDGGARTRHLNGAGVCEAVVQTDLDLSNDLGAGSPPENSEKLGQQLSCRETFTHAESRRPSDEETLAELWNNLRSSVAPCDLSSLLTTLTLANSDQWGTLVQRLMTKDCANSLEETPLGSPTELKGKNIVSVAVGAEHEFSSPNAPRPSSNNQAQAGNVGPAIDTLSQFSDLSEVSFYSKQLDDHVRQLAEQIERMTSAVGPEQQPDSSSAERRLEELKRAFRRKQEALTALRNRRELMRQKKSTTELGRPPLTVDVSPTVHQLPIPEEKSSAAGPADSWEVSSASSAEGDRPVGSAMTMPDFFIGSQHRPDYSEKIEMLQRSLEEMTDASQRKITELQVENARLSDQLREATELAAQLPAVKGMQELLDAANELEVARTTLKSVGQAIGLDLGVSTAWPTAVVTRLEQLRQENTNLLTRLLAAEAQSSQEAVLFNREMEALRLELETRERKQGEEDVLREQLKGMRLDLDESRVTISTLDEENSSLQQIMNSMKASGEQLKHDNDRLRQQLTLREDVEEIRGRLEESLRCNCVYQNRIESLEQQLAVLENALDRSGVYVSKSVEHGLSELSLKEVSICVESESDFPSASVREHLQNENVALREQMEQMVLASEACAEKLEMKNEEILVLRRALSEMKLSVREETSDLMQQVEHFTQQTEDLAIELETSNLRFQSLCDEKDQKLDAIKQSYENRESQLVENHEVLTLQLDQVNWEKTKLFSKLQKKECEVDVVQAELSKLLETKPDQPAFNVPSDTDLSPELIEGDADSESINMRMFLDLREQLTAHVNTLSELKVERSTLLEQLEENSRERENLKNELSTLRDLLASKSDEEIRRKGEIAQLVKTVTSQKEAIDVINQEKLKLIDELRRLSQMHSSEDRIGDSDEMTKEAIRNLSQMVRDKEWEIEALQRKNDSLLQVLKSGLSDESNGETASQIAEKLVEEKEKLTHQLYQFQTDREHLIAALNQKHQESVGYHAELQRLLAVFDEEQEKWEEAEKSQQHIQEIRNALRVAEEEIHRLRSRCNQLQVQCDAGQSSSTGDTEAGELGTLRAELHSAVSLSDRREEELHWTRSRQVELEQESRARQLEVVTLRQQLERVTFELSEAQIRHSDLETTSVEYKRRLEMCGLEMEALRSGVGERVEGGAREEEKEQLLGAIRQKQAEVDQLRRELAVRQDTEGRLLHELERLRSHLVQVEESYTQEAIAAEDRERSLRDHLRHSEQALNDLRDCMDANNREATRRVGVKAEEARRLGMERDAALANLARCQAEVQLQAVSVLNLQTVLDNFQKEQETTVAFETEHWQKEATRLNSQLTSLQAHCHDVEIQLAAQSDLIEAAQRLTDQMDRKEEQLSRIKQSLVEKEETINNLKTEIRRLTNTSESKIDKILMKNLLIGYFHTPVNKRQEALRVIGSLLQFNDDEYTKVGVEVSGKSRWFGWLRQLPLSPGQSHQQDRSFSELFVTFLERESSPHTGPQVRLPTDQLMIGAPLDHPGTGPPGHPPLMMIPLPLLSTASSTNNNTTNTALFIPTKLITTVTSSTSTRRSDSQRNALLSLLEDK